jgi:hypothetical protein
MSFAGGLIDKTLLILMFFVVSPRYLTSKLKSANYATNFDGKQIHSACGRREISITDF